MENLEHLYYEDVLPALKEQLRVSEWMIITTPRPDEVMNLRWLSSEIPEASQDPLPLTPHDYTCLESAVHKSIVYPHSMERCGFEATWTGLSMIYVGKTSRIDLSHLEYDGIRRDEFFSRPFTTLQDKYVSLLKECVSMYDGITAKYRKDIGINS